MMERSDDPYANTPAGLNHSKGGTTPIYGDTWRPQDPECEPDCAGCGVALAHHIALTEVACLTAEDTSSG